MENELNTVRGSSKRSPEELFNKFIEAEDCPEILQSFQRLVHATGVKAETPREFYQNLKSNLQSWKCKSLWELLDNRANQKEYSKGTICEDIHALVIGCGPIGLRTAIELAILGAQVVIVEKRQTFSRNNVLHLWPFLLTDFRSLGAKKFYGKFCSGSIDHISIRRLQSVLLKTALIFGVKVFTGVTFEDVIEPISEEEGWKCTVTPSNHLIRDYEIDVLIGADGKKNVLPGFAQIEMRGTLAIGVTANFVNYYSEEETRVEEISGIAYQFNPGFFQKLKQLKRISLENIVYYKDETHYFVMTAVKSSLLERGVLKQDYGNNPQKLLSAENVDRAKLISYVNDTVEYATKGQLKHRDLKKDKKGNADIAVFDFTSIKKAENSARIKERKGHKLLIGLVGDSLLEPFWPTGSGCARGVLSALDAAWMVRSFSLEKPPLQILSERENIYRLLSGTSSQNLQKNFDLYTINPSSRYMHIPQKKIQEVYHLFDTDDPVNADFSLGSPTGILSTTKGSKKKRVSLGTKPQRRPNRKHIKFAAQSSQDSQNYSPISSSTEDLSAMSTEDKVRFAEPKQPARSRTASENLTSGGEEVHEITKSSKLAKKSRKSRSPPSSSRENQSKMKKSPFDAGLKKKSKRRKSDRASPPTGTAREEKTSKRRSFFGFGRGKNKPRKSPKTPDIPKENKRTVNETIAAEKAPKVQSSNGFTPLGEPAWNKDTAKSPFSRNHSTRRSAREIIAEMEARSKNPENTTAAKKNSVEVPRRRLVELPKPAHEEITRKTSIKRTTSELEICTPQSKHHKKEGLWDELSSLSPSAKGAVPALSKMSPEKQQENHRHESHDIASAMRMAGLMAIAAPLLIDEPTHNNVLYTERSWFSRNNGHVKNTINKYDSLTGKSLLGKKNSKDISPLRPQYDMVDGPSSRSENRPTLVEIAKKLAANQRITSDEPQVDQPSGMDDDEGSSSWQPTAIAFVEGKTGMDEMESSANERARDHERLEKLRRLKEDFSSLDQESTDSPVKKDFSSPIYKKTFIASVQGTPKSKDKTRSKENGHNQIETPRDYAKEAEWRKSPALAKKEMERLMVALTETMSKERAEASIRFLISMFRRIQRNPREEKFRRIFKSRVKFKKYVWTVRNAKMFMFASGWIEVGSFLVFSANKNVREPLAILNKHLGLLASGSSVQISAIKSTPRRDMDPKTPRSARALPFSIPSTPKTPNTGAKTDLTASVPKSNSLNKRETPVRTSGSKHTPMDKRFSKSVPLNLDSEWDLEMEDPLLQGGLSQSAVKRGRLTSSALDVSDKTNSRGTNTPKGRTPTRMPATPDVAIMEEIEGLSNTLDDLMESMEEDPSEVYNSKTSAKKGSCGQEIKDLCTTLDYMLDSSEEEELDRDLNRWKTKEDSASEMNSPAISASAFSKVSLRSPSSKTTATSKKFENRDEISTLSDNDLSSVDLSEINVLETKKDSLENSDEKDNDIRKSDVSVPVSASTNSDFKFNIQKKEKISLKDKEKKKDDTSEKTGAAAKETDNINVKEPRQYSLRPRKTNSKSASSKNIDDAKKRNDGKKTSRRKLPNEPEKPRRPLSVGDLQMQKLASSSKSASNLPKKKRPSSRNSVNSETDAQESKTRIQRKVSDDDTISKTEISANIHKDKPFAISKAKSKSTTTLSDSTVEAKRKSSANMASKNSARLSLTSKSKSEMNVSGKVDATTSSKTHEKQKSSSLNRKQSSSSESMSTTQKVEKIRTVPRNSGQLPEGNKKIELDSENKFKKPSVPKSRSRRPETSKTAGKSRESTSEESLSISRLDNSLKSRPPSGLGRTRSARERKRKEIASKLDSLETSYETLEKSPNRTLNDKKNSTSSIESNASSLSKKTSLTDTVTEQQRSSLRNKGTVSRTSSAASRSSATSGEDITETTSRTRRSTTNDSVNTKRRSSAKRTPSNASLERKKMDGLLTKEEQSVLRKRSKSASAREKPSAPSTNDNLENIRLLRSKAVDISQLRRADSSESESLRRSGSFKAKHRRAATRSSSKSQDDTQAKMSSNLEHSSRTSSERPPADDVEQNMRSADDSFDDITVAARNCEESVVDGYTGDVGTAFKKEINENENSPFSLRRKHPGGDGKSMAVDSTDFISSNLNIKHQELGSQTSTPNNHEQNDTKMPEKNASEGKDIQEESDSSSLTDDTKMEFRLRNTGSWMVLDYEGLKESPKMLKKISLSSENNFDDQSPRASISSVDTVITEKMNGDDSVLRMEGSTVEDEDEDETTLTHDKENGNIVSPGEDKLESLITNGSMVSEIDNGFFPAHGEIDAHAQNGDVKPYSNGTASNGSIPPSDPHRKEPLKKKTKGSNLKPKSKKLISQSVENLTSDKNRVKFEEIQNLDVPRASTLNRSPKGAKKHTFPFALRKKKTSGSCSDLNGRSPDIMVEGPSPTKTMTGSKTAPHGLIMTPEDKSFSSPHDKSYEKKKLAPFKVFKKRKSQDAST